MAAQRIAAENANITAEVYDINHFVELKTRYNIMSVPCMPFQIGRTLNFTPQLEGCGAT